MLRQFKERSRGKTFVRIKDEWLPQTNQELSSSNYNMVNYPYGSHEEFGEIMIVIKEKGK